MMSNLISPSQQKMLALTLLGLLIWMIFASMVIPAFDNIAERRDQIQLLEKRVQNYQQVLASEDPLKSRLNDLSTQPVTDLFYLGTDEDDLVAYLSRDVRDLFSSMEVNIENMRSGSIEDEDGMKRISVQIRTKLYMEDLVAVLRSIRSHQKMLSLENITIDVKGMRDENTAPLIEVRFDVIGFGLLNVEETGA